MPEGALLTGTIDTVLLDLADQLATGCLQVRDQEGDVAEVFLRDGQVYAVSVPGRRTMLGVRLMSRGALTPEALAESLEIQRTELQGWRLGELLVHLGYVDLEIVEEFVVEHLKDALADLLGWPVAAWKFRKNKKTRQDVAPPTPVRLLLDDMRDRATTWETILLATGGPEAVPALASGSPDDGVALGPNEWALLCKVDAERTIADLATECGFTLFEAGQVVMRLAEAGLVQVERGFGAVAEPDPAVAQDEQDSGGTAELVLPLVAFPDATQDHEVARLAQEETERIARYEADRVETERAAAERAETERVEAERAEAERVSHSAETSRLREAEIVHRELEALAAREAKSRSARKAARVEARRIEQEQAQRAKETKVRDAAEEAAWADHAAWLQEQHIAIQETAWADHAAWLAQERASLEVEAWSAHAAWLSNERARVEQDAWADHTTWLAEQFAATEALAWADHAAWLAHERAALEEEAWATHTTWLEVERAAAEAQAELERAAEAQAELERAAEAQAELERAAEAQAELERAAAEQADQERRAAEARAELERAAEAQAEVERAAEAQAAQQRRETRARAERELQVEVDRRARLAADNAVREEAERIASEEAERIEAERVIGEQAEAERAEVERAAREAADEAERAQAQAEAERAQAQAEAERAEAQAEAERAQAQAEAERAEVERVQIEAAEEAAEAERAEAEVERVAREAAEEAERAEAAALLRATAQPPVDIADDADDAETLVHSDEQSADDAWMRAANAAQAANLLSELTRDASMPPAAKPDPEPEPAPMPVAAEAAPAEETPAPFEERERADTAALLRELSSLGFGDDSSRQSQPSPSTPRAAAPVGDNKKKRKGLFSRG